MNNYYVMAYLCTIAICCKHKKPLRQITRIYAIVCFKKFHETRIY